MKQEHLMKHYFQNMVIKCFYILFYYIFFLVFSFNRIFLMSKLKIIFSQAESVSEGHPDKVSDRISDMVVDTYLSNDPFLE